MKGRDYKPNYEGLFAHAYSRGVNKSIIFFDDQDYKNFIYRARILIGLDPLPKRNKNRGSLRLKVLAPNAIEILSYCLMPNHFHFLIKQNSINGIRQFLQRLLTSYSSYFNKKYGHSGHIFQGAYKSKTVLEDAYLTQLTAYIHLNPSNPFDWKYSSIRRYLGIVTDDLSSPELFMQMHQLTPERYRDFLEKHYDVNMLSAADLIFVEE